MIFNRKKIDKKHLKKIFLFFLTFTYNIYDKVH